MDFAIVNFNNKDQKIEVGDFFYKRFKGHLIYLELLHIDFIKDERSMIEANTKTNNNLLEYILPQLKNGSKVIIPSLFILGDSFNSILGHLISMVSAGSIVYDMETGLIIKGSIETSSKELLKLMNTIMDLEKRIRSEKSRISMLRSKSNGTKIGRPKGAGKKKLDGRDNEILALLDLQMSKKEIASRLGVSQPTLNAFIRNDLKIQDK
jgi:hypothetical protein